jgi:hypothetical protein
MIESDLERLGAQHPDHSLSALESDIWAAVARREESGAVLRTVLLAQAVVLAIALAGSAVTGYQQGTRSSPSDLGVFSPHAPLAASTLLVGDPE